MAGGCDSSLPPRPAVRVHLYTASVDDPTQRGALKLTALLRPMQAMPLASRVLLCALSKAPLALLSSFLRILYVAGILHYAKRLDVYLRPDPLPAAAGWRPESPAGGVDSPLPLGTGVTMTGCAGYNACAATASPARSPFLCPAHTTWTRTTCFPIWPRR